jgi:hypothetical protein
LEINSNGSSIAASNHLNKNNMKAFNFFRDKQAISRKEFESSVPANWIDLVDEAGYFSWGYFWCQFKD